VLDDEARLDLETLLIVEKGARQTNSYLKLETLLISEKAHARVVPALEIMEDDVKSGHGATVTQIDKDQLDYLRSRGLNEKQAQRLIIKGFLN
jgi:Fe-S cluster assembly protein SufD